MILNILNGPAKTLMEKFGLNVKYLESFSRISKYCPNNVGTASESAPSNMTYSPDINSLPLL